MDGTHHALQQFCKSVDYARLPCRSVYQLIYHEAKPLHGASDSNNISNRLSCNLVVHTQAGVKFTSGLPRGESLKRVAFLLEELGSGSQAGGAFADSLALRLLALQVTVS